MELEGLVAVVTGGAQGMGKAHARCLADKGAAIAVADIKGEDAEAVARALPQAIAAQTDVTQEAEVEALVKATLEAFGRIDILVNNAGGNNIPIGPFWEISEPDWSRIIDVNLKGQWLCSKAVFPAMRDVGRGRIINIVSLAVYNGSPGFSAYSAAKGGVLGLTRTLAHELGPYNITVNAVAPGLVGGDGRDKPFTDEEWVAMEERWKSRQLLKERKVMAEDVAAAVAFLASPAADLITGELLAVDGGAKLFR